MECGHTKILVIVGPANIRRTKMKKLKNILLCGAAAVMLFAPITSSADPADCSGPILQLTSKRCIAKITGLKGNHTPIRELKPSPALETHAASWSKIPCQTVMNDKYGGAVPDEATDYLSSLDFGSSIGSTSGINLRSFIAAECRLHPRDTIGAAVERLLHTPPSKLPNIPIGGA
jgi:hypothetical protein